jgi:prefoldin subunit 5
MKEPPERSPDTPPAASRPDASAAPPAEDRADAAREAKLPPEPPPDEVVRPATVEEVRTLRRWLLVTGVWAVAATAIAAIALVQANRFDEEELNARTAGQIREVQDRLQERITDLESRIEALPTAEDIADLDNRLGEVENRAGTTTDRLEEVTGRLDDLEQRVEEVEQSQTETETQTETEANP